MPVNCPAIPAELVEATFFGHVRVLAATNTDLQAKIAEGSFRQDFYYRLATVTVIVPPLRERKDDNA